MIRSERISSQNYERENARLSDNLDVDAPRTSVSGSTVPKVVLHRKRNVVITVLINMWKHYFLR